MKLRILLIASVLGLSLLRVVSCQRGENAAAASSKDAPGAAKGVVQTPTVATIRVPAREVSATVQATGSFVAHDASDVAPNVAGIIVATLVDVGDFVQRGQVIARLDSRDAALRLDQARAAQQQAMIPEIARLAHVLVLVGQIKGVRSVRRK